MKMEKNNDASITYIYILHGYRYIRDSIYIFAQDLSENKVIHFKAVLRSELRSVPINCLKIKLMAMFKKWSEI